MSGEENKKDLSQVILEIDSKMDTCLQYLANIDQSYKLILSDMRKQPKPAPPVPEPPKQAGLPSAEPFMGELPSKTKKPLKKVEKPVETKQAAKTEKPKATEKLITVTQKIQYQNGDAVPLVKIRLSDANGKMVKETMTNPNGKWKVPLAVGKYYLMAFHGAIQISGKIIQPAIEHKMEFEVDGEKNPLELPTLGTGDEE